MIRRRRHTLDLLPLLDIFMVVLFVFATIQEGALGDSQQTIAGLRAELAAEQARAAELEAAGRVKEAAAAAGSDAQSELERAREELLGLREAVQRTREALEQASAGEGVAGSEQLRRQEILSKLIDHFSVFEIEIDGELQDGEVVNHCCYRTEPFAAAWHACGRLPASSAELRGWLADGGAGLVEALRRTRGGNALTIVRQSERATWRVGRKLEEQLRERFPEHKIYDEGIAAHQIACVRSPTASGG
jgi:hypothetical protein